MSHDLFASVPGSDRAGALQDLYANLLARTSDAVIVWELRGGVTSWNHGAEVMYGYSHGEAVGRAIHDLLQTVLPQPREAFEADLERTGSWEGELTQTTRDGERLTVESRQVFGRDSDRAYVLAINRNVTERRDAEAGLRRSEGHLRLIADRAPAFIAHVDRHHRFLYVNDAYAHRFGTTPAELIGRRLEDVLGKAAYESILPSLARVQRGERFSVEIEVPYDALGKRLTRCTYEPEFDVHGDVQGWIAVVTDVTDARKAEDILKTTARRKDEFLAMLAHELRNPLAPIRNAVRVLEEPQADDAARRHAREIIDRQSEHLTRIVDDLLDVSRITEGKVTLRKERLELQSVVGRALEMSRPLVEARRHTLSVSLPPQPIYLDGDLTRLSQVLSNLLNNAAKYTPDGGRIAVDAASTGDRFVLSVTDNGDGIAREHLSDVFDLFVQVDRGSDRTDGGLGVGLTLVRKLVELHGGTVTAHSDGPGQGSEFRIELPTTPEDSERRDDVPAPHSHGAAAMGYRILVVDDNVDSAESMGLLLQFAGHQVQLAHDGHHAIDTAARFHPHIVLLDIGLPGIDGYGVARSLRSQAVMRDAVLIALTGYGQEEDRRRARAAGFDHHLTKPVDPGDLHTLIGSLSFS